MYNLKYLYRCFWFNDELDKESEEMICTVYVIYKFKCTRRQRFNSTFPFFKHICITNDHGVNEFSGRAFSGYKYMCWSQWAPAKKLCKLYETVGVSILAFVVVYIKERAPCLYCG